MNNSWSLHGNSCYIHNNINVRARARQLLFGLSLLALAACSDWRDGIVPENPATAKEAELAFRATVVPGSMATRADGSIVNLNETSLPETKERSYWRYNPTTKLVEEEKETFQVGVFGCYTGQHKWNELVTLSEKASPTDVEKQTLADYYSANLLYNQPADIAAPIDGVNTLSYTPLRFWPNQKRTESGTDKYDYATFWAYYPYNPTAIPGTYGISINSNTMGTGMGMGSVTFTMHPDAAQQNDFMISMPVTDCNRDTHPLRANSTLDGFEPTPVRFRFYHMLAQVRLYAFIRGTDKLAYEVDGGGDPVYYSEGETYTDAWGKTHTVTAEEAGKIQKIDEANSIRWARETTTDITGNRYRADISYKMEFNNIKTAATFFPKYTSSGVTINYTDATTLGSATVNHYIMNPYWFRFYPSDYEDVSKRGDRYMLNDHYMYGWFEDTPAFNATSTYASNTPSMSGSLLTVDEDGYDWSQKASNVLGYHIDNGTTADPGIGMEFYSEDAGKHYNYPPGNILMVVPQVLSDDDVPHIVITATGKQRVWDSSLNGGAGGWKDGEALTAKVTVNLLQMNLKWESGFIYSYAFIDELKPGDDIVRGPESITVVFDTSKHTDQW